MLPRYTLLMAALLSGSILLVSDSSEAAAPPGRYMVGADVVTDTVSGLTWQRRVNQNTQSLRWEEAQAYCNNLVLGGHSDWRMPNIKELQSLIDETVESPTIDTAAFPGTAAEPFWSGTPRAGSMRDAWMVSFANGTVLTFARLVPLLTRCVR